MAITRRGFLGAIAGGLVALRLNLGSGQTNLEVKHERSPLKTESWDAWWKAHYPDEVVADLAYRSHPLLGTMRKSDEWSQYSYVLPITSGSYSSQ